MELNQLRYVVALAEEANFSRAAARLSVSVGPPSARKALGEGIARAAVNRSHSIRPRLSPYKLSISLSL